MLYQISKDFSNQWIFTKHLQKTSTFIQEE